MARLVLSDASPLIALARIDRLDWVESLFGCVHVTPTVRAEIVPRGEVTAPGELAIEAALDHGLIVEATKPEPTLADLPLDVGERTTLEASLEAGSESLVVMDDRAGRRVARELGIHVTGTAALVGVAKRRGLIESAAEVFDRLEREDFRIAPAVVASILAAVDERDLR